MRQYIKRFWCLALVMVLLAPVVFLATAWAGREDAAFETSANQSASYAVDAQWSTPLLAEIGAGPSSAAANRTGRGVKIGVVDTGVDPSVLLPSLVTDWVDVTEEGAVTLSGPLQVSSSHTITLDGRTLDVAGITTKSGRLRAGIFDPTSLPPASPVRSAMRAEPLTIVMADTRLAGQYDTIFIDTNYDGSFASEKGLERYKDTKVGVAIPLRTAGRTFYVVVCEYRGGGETVVLGFDGHGHGTSVASILGGRTKGLSPMTPQAEIIAVKAVDSTGRTRWDLLAQGILAACSRGAKIVIMSVAPLVPNESSGLLEEALRKAEKDYGALVVMAAGNTGPGLGSLPTYADLSNVVAVGGFIPQSASAAMNIDGGKMWPWSSIGPTAGGGTVSVVAPALGPAASPAWASSVGETWVFEGTSAAAAYAGGAAALVLSADTQTGSMAPAVLKRILEDGARPLAGHQAVEQGFGVIQVAGSIGLLNTGRGYPRMRAVARWGDGFQAGGFFDRNRIPGAIPLGVDSFNPIEMSLTLMMPSWLSTDSQSLSIPAVEQRDLQLRVDGSLPGGLVSGYVKGDDTRTPGTDMAFLVTAVNPRRLGQSGAIGLQNALSLGGYHREYVAVDSGLAGLSVSLGVPKTAAGNPRGREKLYVYDPQGWLIYESPWIGAGESLSETRTDIVRPTAGVWEIIVVSDPQSNIYDVVDAAFRLSISNKGMAVRGPEGTLTQNGPGGQAVGSVAVVNPGSGFSSSMAVIEPGKNGEVIIERLVAPVSTSLTKSVSGVTQDTKHIYLAATNPSDPATKMDIFLYFYGKELGRWTEVASSASLGDSTERYVSLKDPTPGQYIAYVEARDQNSGQTTFTWTQIVSRTATGYKVREKQTENNSFAWSEASEATVTVEVPVSSNGTRNQGTVYLAIWDESTAALKGLIPLSVVAHSPKLVLFLGEGSTSGGQTMVTVMAYHPVTFAPLDAMVSVDGVWCQLRQGRATLILDRPNVRGVELVGEYPGLYPARVTVP